MKTVFLPFAILLTLCSSGLSQTVEMQIPDTKKIVEGKLSVLFKDTVSEEHATRAIIGLGYSIAESRFKPVVVIAHSNDSLSAESLKRLRGHPAFVRIIHTDMGRVREITLQKMKELYPEQAKAFPDTISFPRFMHSIHFSSSAKKEEILDFINAIVELKDVQIKKSPNQLVINVPKGKDEQAVRQLRKNRMVEEVSYIVAE